MKRLDTGDPGPSLAEAVDAVGALPEESVLWIAAAVAGALAVLHRAGRVHGDIRPVNVLLTGNGPRLTGSDGDRTAGGSGRARTPGRNDGPHEPSGDLVALGMLLITAYTGRRSGAAPVSSRTPDISTLPVRLRQVVAVCLAEEPAAQPTAQKLLDVMGSLTPAPYAWPREVDELIAVRQAGGPADATGRAPRSAPPAEPPNAPDVLSSPPGPARSRLAALGMAVVLAGAITAVILALVPGHGSGMRTAEAPLTSQPSLWQPTREAPSEEPTEEPTEAPQQSAPEQDPATEPAAPTSQVPTSPATQQTRQQGVIDDCSGAPLTEPTMLTLACGDGGAVLLDLTWSDWGEPAASAQGWVAEVSCVPSCVEGGEVRSPATVTVSGLAGGRYTVMEVRAPRSPVQPVALYSLDELGPTLRN
ncbi:hypothetical protein [Streptomyces sp. NPDC007205]|uniref:hypothetical protein n=1 Tax=Streptomyces sp. NPDC007205 TaxID=3154316 RepID=UPI0033D99847